MESEPLNVLLIGNDAAFIRAATDALRAADESTTVNAVPTLDAGLAKLKGLAHDAIVYELPTANTASLFQITLLTAKVPRLPVIAAGPTNETTFAAEVIHAGAQDYVEKEPFDARTLPRTVRCAIERHREHVLLIEEKDNYYGVFDHLVEGVFRTTPDGHYLLANVALAAIYGYGTPVELMASIKDIAGRLYVEPGRREEFVRLMREHDTLSGFESEIYRKDGTRIWISENCRAVRDSRGGLLYYEGTVEDITQRRQMGEALQRSESLYHSLVEAMPQGVFRRDLQGRFTFANQPYCKYHRVQPEDILGKSDFDLYPKEAADKYWRDDVKIMESGETMEIIEESQPVGREEKQYHHVIKTPLRDEAGRVIGLQGMLWDITEKKRAEEQIRRTTAELGRSREELRVKNLAMEENLRMAHEIQLAMLPQQYPTLPRTLPPEQGAFKFAHRYHPAETVSGDFFSISTLSDTDVGVFICDVTGHGVRAALVTAMIRALAEELKPLAHDPGNFLRKLNSDLCSILKSTGSPMLTTAFYLVANWQTGIMRFANAGHPKPLVLRRSANRIETLANECGRGQPALGLFDDPTYQTTETTLTPGDLVMLFTDGLYEVQGANEELYSQQRLLLDVKNLLHKPAGELFDELLENIRVFAVSHEFEDDVCLVGMEFSGQPPARS
jgi:sigma-B regulation protein RsbU (phosphoserine phosphatase)